VGRVHLSRPLALALVFAVAGCATVPARMTYRELDSRAMHKPMAFGVYTPPGFRPDERLPLFVFLHGGGDTVHCLDVEGIAAWLDQEITAGRVPRVVVLVPEGDRGFWANWADGSHRYLDWVLREAMPAAISGWHTQPCPGGCHLIGISMGGNGALRLVLAHPGLFRSAAILSGPTPDAQGMKELSGDWLFHTFARLDRVFGPEIDEHRLWAADPFQRWTAPDDLAGLRLFIAHGDDDRRGIGETNDALHRDLLDHGIPHRFEVFHGGHRWRDWQPLFGEAIRDGLGE
jgi:enterochelin esterase-like enzyme